MKIKTVLKIPFKVGDNAYFETYENNATICLGVQGHKIKIVESFISFAPVRFFAFLLR